MVRLWHVKNSKVTPLPRPFSLLATVACTLLSFLKFITNVQHIPSQMTVQELSSMIRSDIKPIIFVINNGGYTIERLQHNINGSVSMFFLNRIPYSRLSVCGNREYHNIVTWDYGDLLKVLSNSQSSPTQTYRVTTEKELGNLLDTENIRDKGCLQLVEIVVGRDDAPPALLRALGLQPTDSNSKGSSRVHKKIGGTLLQRAQYQGLVGW